MGSEGRQTGREPSKGSALFDRLPEAQNLEWWPSHVRRAFANLGEALGRPQLHPDILAQVRRDGLPDHEIVFSHQKDAGARKGMYRLEIIGPIYAGQWAFRSGFLETMARAAASAAITRPAATG
jgi:hypothetical protein